MFILDQRQSQREITIVFALSAVIPIMALVLPTGYAFPTRLAAAGGMLAVYGTFLIATPVWRAGGPFAWIANEAVHEALGGDPDERDTGHRYEDRFYSTLNGQMVIGIGTEMNALSGFCSA